MRLWKFYAKRKEIKDDALLKALSYDRTGDEDTIKSAYPLYAFTNNKKKAMEFMSTRNMDIFIVKSSKYYDQDEYVNYHNRHPSEDLGYYDLTTYSRKINEEGQYIKTVKVLMTESEYVFVDSETEEETISVMLESLFTCDCPRVPSPKIFKREYQDLLLNTLYVSFYYVFLLEHVMTFEHWSRRLMAASILAYDPEDGAGTFTTDQLQTFIELYGAMFKL